MIVQLAHNATTAKLLNASKEVKLTAMKILSYKVDGARTTASWDGTSTFFDYTTGTFPAGFVHRMQEGLQKAGHKVQLLRKPFPTPLGPEMPVVDDFGFDPRYDYQPHVMEKLVRHGQIIAQVATGGGKSRIAKLCYARIHRPTLFLTTRSVLMYQMKDSFENDLKVPVGVFGDDQWGYKAPDGSAKLTRMSVGMVQTFAEHLKELDKSTTPKAKYEKHMARRQNTIELLSKFEFVILEEAHEASGNSYYEIMRHCTNAHYRLALTATPFMKESEEANMRLMACSGDVAIRVSEELLIHRGILAKPYFKYVDVEKPERLLRSIPWPRCYKWGIVESTPRNDHVVYEAFRAVQYGLPVMILAQHIEHGKILNDMIAAAGMKVQFIRGESDQLERRMALNNLKDGKINVLIGTTVLDVGVDVPAVGMVILAGGGKAEVALRQRIGRGLRAKKFGPNVAFIVDFTDSGNTILKEHGLQRRLIVERTPGFREGILPPANDFDFEGLGFVRKAA